MSHPKRPSPKVFVGFTLRGPSWLNASCALDPAPRRRHNTATVHPLGLTDPHRHSEPIEGGVLPLAAEVAVPKGTDRWRIITPLLLGVEMTI